MWGTEDVKRLERLCRQKRHGSALKVCSPHSYVEQPRVISEVPPQSPGRVSAPLHGRMRLPQPHSDFRHVSIASYCRKTDTPPTMRPQPPTLQYCFSLTDFVFDICVLAGMSYQSVRVLLANPMTIY